MSVCTAVCFLCSVPRNYPKHQSGCIHIANLSVFVHPYERSQWLQAFSTNMSLQATFWGKYSHNDALLIFILTNASTEMRFFKREEYSSVDSIVFCVEFSFPRLYLQCVAQRRSGFTSDGKIFKRSRLQLGAAGLIWWISLLAADHHSERNQEGREKTSRCEAVIPPERSLLKCCTCKSFIHAFS